MSFALPVACAIMFVISFAGTFAWLIRREIKKMEASRK